MKVINLFAGPGAGKSTNGLILAGLLKIEGYAVEFVPEFAKFAVWSDNQAALSDQIYMFAKQENRLHVLRSAGLDYVITDGPLPQALLYCPPDYYPSFRQLVLDVYNSYENLNFFLDRNPELPYQAHGRLQTEGEAQQLCANILSLCDEADISLNHRLVTPDLPQQLVEAVKAREANALLGAES